MGVLLSALPSQSGGSIKGRLPPFRFTLPPADDHHRRISGALSHARFRHLSGRRPSESAARQLTGRAAPEAPISPLACVWSARRTHRACPRPRRPHPPDGRPYPAARRQRPQWRLEDGGPCSDGLLASKHDVARPAVVRWSRHPHVPAPVRPARHGRLVHIERQGPDDHAANLSNIQSMVERLIS